MHLFDRSPQGTSRIIANSAIQRPDLASRLAVLGTMEGWCAEYVRASYRRWFVEGSVSGSEPNLLKVWQRSAKTHLA